jgi:hypothetical protein
MYYFLLVQYTVVLAKNAVRAIFHEAVAIRDSSSSFVDSECTLKSFH